MGKPKTPMPSSQEQDPAAIEDEAAVDKALSDALRHRLEDAPVDRLKERLKKRDRPEE